MTKLHKHTLLLRAGDFQAIGDAFPKQGASAIIRKIVSQFANKLNRPLTEEELEDFDE